MANVLARRDNKEYTIADSAAAAWAAKGYTIYDLNGYTIITPAVEDVLAELAAEYAAYKAVNPPQCIGVVASAAKAIVKAASAATDTLTIMSTVALGVASNALKVALTTAADDVLAVTKDDGTKTINIALAKTTAANNTAALVQTAVRALATVGGVDVSAFVCVPGGAWNTAAKATGETGAVGFSGGKASTAAIVGLTAPVKAAAPDIVIPATDMYTARVYWTPAVVGNAFAADTAYTANIVLDPKPGYTVEGVAENFFTLAGASAVTNAVNTGLVAAVFAKTAA